MKRIYFPIIVLILLIFNSCSTDLDINAEWEDIPVIFCVLDQSQQYQYVKVNKTFLGEQPASVMAQYSDSLYYNKVEVFLHEYQGEYFNLSKIRTIKFDETDTIPKEPGYFASERNVVFISDVQLNENYKYKIDVKIDDGRKTIESELVELISGAVITRPSPSILYTEMSNYNNPIKYEFYWGFNAKVAQVKIFFNYIEVLNNDTSYHSIEWVQAVDVRSNVNENVPREKSYETLAFYAFLNSNIPPLPENAKRYVKMPNSYEYKLAIANEDYRTYMEVSAPSHGIIQDKPSYTNMNGGFGLFASKFNTNRIVKIGPSTLDSISRGIHTSHLGFEGRYSLYYLPHF